MPVDLPRRLADGLVLRRSRPDDTERLAEFTASIHTEHEDGRPNEGVAIWTRDLMSGRHPTFRPDDFTIVEDAASSEIVSCLNLIPQTWAYRGIEFPVGRVELVGTLPRYRRRGLVAAQMDVVHAWCSDRRIPVQGITGIPHYYRRFGYEMALPLGGGRAGRLDTVTSLEDGEVEPYALRPAAPEDAAFMSQCAARGRDRWLVADAWDEVALRWLAAGHSVGSEASHRVWIIEDRRRQPAGFAAWRPEPHRGAVRVALCELADGYRWPEVLPSVVRYVQAWAAEKIADGAEISEIAFGASAHPAFEVAATFFRRTWPPYGWYLRVPDLAGFVRHLAPALEWRLADSAYAGYDGDLKMRAGDDGLLLRFAGGLIDEVVRWAPDDFEAGDVLFPERTFLQLLFGLRDLGFLQDAYPDCRAYTDAGYGLTEALFPSAPSYVIGME